MIIVQKYYPKHNHKNSELKYSECMRHNYYKNASHVRQPYYPYLQAQDKRQNRQYSNGEFLYQTLGFQSMLK